jgi:endonuclease YncB( thermonuclease family)
MKLFVFIAIVTTLSAPLSASAQGKSEQSLRDFLKNSLNAPVNNSCSVLEVHGKSPGGPFEVLDQCDEGELAGLKTITGKVYRVVDGDTIHFYYKNKTLGIRMLGMDTPELHYHSRAQPKWGVIARDSLRSLVESGDVITLELDKVRCDRYGRVLGHVFKGKMNLNFEQIRRGYAVNYCIYPNMKHCDGYQMAYLKAQEERLRIHTDQCFVTPYIWRRAMDSAVMEKKLKDSRTGEYYSPKDYYLVPVAYRIFYSTVHQ